MGKVKIGNFKGPQGETGPQGPAGPRGPEGPQGPMGEVDANTQIVFTQATNRENIASGEKLNIILGKIRKWFADIKGAAFQDVSNTLTTTEAGKVLDARQGKVLDEKVAKKLDKTDVVNGLTETAEGKALDARQGKVLDEKVSDLNSKLNEPHLVITEQMIGPFTVNNGAAITEELVMTPPEGYKLALPIMGQTGTRYAFQYSCVGNTEVENGYIIQLANYSGYNASGFTPKMYFICKKEQ